MTGHYRSACRLCKRVDARQTGAVRSRVGATARRASASRAWMARLDCWPCFLRQALSAARRAGAPPAMQRAILEETMAELRALSAQATPPEMGERIHRLVRDRTRVPDPYLDVKQAATARALALLPELRARVAAAADPLETAVRIAIAGNIIDDGVAEHFDLEATLERVLHAAPAIDDVSVLRRAIAPSDRSTRSSTWPTMPAKPSSIGS